MLCLKTLENCVSPNISMTISERKFNYALNDFEYIFRGTFKALSNIYGWFLCK